MSEHRSPKKGYSSREKQSYRRAVWRCMSDAIRWANEERGYILILPGNTCKEIDVALRAGLRADKIILVHESQWDVDNTCEWRHKYPDMRYYVGLLSDLIPRFEEDKIPFVGANLDLCGNFSPEMVDQFSSFCDYAEKSAPYGSPITVGLTMMKGRESTAMVKILEKLHSRNNPIGLQEKRLEIMIREFGCQLRTQHVSNIGQRNTEVNILGEGAYIHAKAPMSWAVVEYLHPQAWERRLLDNCQQEARHVMSRLRKLKKFTKRAIQSQKYGFWEGISEADFVEAMVIAREVYQIADHLYPKRICRDDMPQHLKTYFKMTDGHKSGKKALFERFLSKEEQNEFREFLHCYLGVWCYESDKPQRIPDHLKDRKDELFLRIESKTLGDVGIHRRAARISASGRDATIVFRELSRLGLPTARLKQLKLLHPVDAEDYEQWQLDESFLSFTV